MRSKTNHRYYYCKHCGSRHTSKTMADIYYDLDMKILESKERKLTKIEKR
jgi:hypothetical protein